MKSSKILRGIAIRAATATPIEPRFLALPYEGGVDDFNTLTWDLRDEFPFLHSGQEELDNTDIAKLDGLFAWLIEQLRKFPGDVSAPKRRLVDILALATMLEGNAELWGEIAQAVPRLPPLLIDTIAKVFTDTRPDGREVLKREHYSPTQISTVLDDVARKNWESAVWTMDRLWGRVWLPIKIHAAAALHQYDRPRLEALIDRADDLFEVAAYVLHAPVTQTLTLALTSKNWTFKFWAFHRSAKLAAMGEPCFPIEWESLLTQAAASPEEWTRWLAVMNTHPARYPQIQPALGTALAGASNEALEAYVASISNTGDFARLQLADALGVFRNKAPLPVRQRVWTAAFRRWEAWNFGCDDEMRGLFHVARSSFDYPVMGYLTECLSTEARANMNAELEARAANIERAWHSGVTSAMSERFKLISIHQLLAHAETVTAGAPEWLAGDPLYKPTWENGTAYRSLKYDLEMGKATF